METISKLSLTNHGKSLLRLIIEPWADQYKIEPEAKVEIVGGEDRIESQIAVDYYDDGFIVVHGWSNGMKVMIDGEEMEEDFT